MEMKLINGAPIFAIEKGVLIIASKLKICAFAERAREREREEAYNANLKVRRESTHDGSLSWSFLRFGRFWRHFRRRKVSIPMKQR